MFDERNGGFGNAPKFPHPSTLDLLIDYQARTGSEALRDVIVITLEKMARGGVYDQLAGGFHRYSVDERWIVPHFEKMCYDNSELLKNYVHACQATGNIFSPLSPATSSAGWMNGSATATMAAFTPRRTPTTRWTTTAITSPGPLQKQKRP